MTKNKRKRNGNSKKSKQPEEDLLKSMLKPNYESGDDSDTESHFSMNTMNTSNYSSNGTNDLNEFSRIELIEGKLAEAVEGLFTNTSEFLLNLKF